MQGYILWGVNASGGQDSQKLVETSWEQREQHVLGRGASLSVWDNKRVWETVELFVQINHKNGSKSHFCLFLFATTCLFKSGAPTLPSHMKFVSNYYNPRLSPELWSYRKVLVAQLCPTLCDPMDYSPLAPLSILQARILEWVAIPYSRRSSPPRVRSCISCIAGRFFTIGAKDLEDASLYM